MDQNYQEITLNEIRPSPFNPRKRFEGPKMDELIASVKSKGVIEPVLVRPFEAPPETKKTAKNLSPAAKYELVAGERRWRAALAAAAENGGPDQNRIPALVRELSDDEAFDLMMIENLQREDLNELEEARGFKIYLKRRGDGRQGELAERTGISPRYIRRRLAVLRLPKKVLKCWEKGQLTYSHLEQLMRVKDDKKLVAEMVDNALRWDLSSREMREHVDRLSPQLKKAVFDTKAAGCGNCRNNSDVQRQLFDLETEGKKCLKPDCFKRQLNDYLAASWPESSYSKDFRTCGFRFKHDLDWNDYDEFHKAQRGPWKACRSCEKFVTIIDEFGRIYAEKACLDAACLKQRRAGGKQQKKNGDPGRTGETEAAGPRVPWHGDYFREKFYRASIPQRFATAIKTTADTPDAAEKEARLVMFALLKSAIDLHRWLAGRLGIEVDENDYWYRMDDEQLFNALEKMDYGQLLDLKAAATLEIILQESFGHIGRRLVAGHIGVDLKTEFRIDEEYLQKKTKAEMIAIGEQFGVFEQKCVKDFLFETLLKKRGNYKGCKKGELIRLFLESGADLAGVVPDEILAGEKTGHDE